MTNSNKLLDRIRNEGIEPKPKWHFLSRQWSVWTVFIISILFGALAFSVILFSIQQTDFELFRHLAHSKAEFLLGILPFFWLIGLFLFLGFAFYSIQYSKKAYKISTAKLVGLSTAMSILLGTIYFIAGGADQLEKTFATNLALYEGLEQQKIKLWTVPEEGYLSGHIIQSDPKEIRLKDHKGNIWTISYTDAFVAPIVDLIKGERIKIIGKTINKGHFTAEEIRPWQGRGKRNRRGNK